MNNRVKSVLINLASEWKEFAQATCLSQYIVGYIDLDDKSDELKMDSFLEELTKRNPSNYMIMIENALVAIGKLDILSEVKFLQASGLLKSYYTRSYGDSQYIEQVNTGINLMTSNVDLTYINADDVLTSSSCVTFDELDYFVKKLNDVSNVIIGFEEVFLVQPQLVLLSGIAGIGKTSFLQKCVFCWAKGLLWKNVDLVLYFEFKKLNKFSHVSNPQEMINKFYKNILKGHDIMSSKKTVMFIIDGLEEFIHLEHLYSCISRGSSNLPIVSTLMHVLSTKNIKCVLGGRVESVMKYQSLVKGREDILHIQILGFSKLSMIKYYESNLMSKTLRSDLQKIISSSSFAKALLSIPFYTKAISSTLSLCFDGYSLKTMTELQTLIFIHFVQQINKTAEPLYGFIQRKKHHILNVCSAAFNMLDEGRTFVSEAELATILDDNGCEPFGFIVKFNISQQYQFVHLFLMKFCASLHLYFYKNPLKLLKHERLRSCLPVACGLLNANGRNFVSVISELQEPFHTKDFWLREICGMQNLFSKSVQ